MDSLSSDEESLTDYSPPVSANYFYDSAVPGWVNIEQDIITIRYDRRDQEYWETDSDENEIYTVLMDSDTVSIRSYSDSESDSESDYEGLSDRMRYSDPWYCFDWKRQSLFFNILLVKTM